MKIPISHTVQHKTSNTVSLGNYFFDIDRETLYRNDNAKTPIPLTTVESTLLRMLASASGTPVSRDELAAKSGVALSPRTVDVQVTRLRRKIEPDSKKPIYIRTVRHQGYVLWPD